MTYAEQVEVVKAVYEPRILGLLNRIRAELEEAGFEVGEPHECSDEEFEWWLTVYLPDDDPEDLADRDLVDIRFVIEESKAYGDDEKGITFAIHIVHFGGAYLGSYSPYNYTPEVWVPLDDPEAIEERFRLMEQVEGIVECLEGALA